MEAEIVGLSARLRATLETRKMSRKHAALLCGCTSKQMSSWCQGNNPGSTAVKALCDGLGISADYLLGVSFQSEDMKNATKEQLADAVLELKAKNSALKHHLEEIRMLATKLI